MRGEEKEKIKVNKNYSMSGWILGREVCCLESFPLRFSKCAV